MKANDVCRKLSCFFLVLLLAGKTAVAVNWPPVSTLGIEHGLSNNGVRAIFRDHNGFMWIGTYDGLNRFDGYNCRVFRNNGKDTNSLINNLVLGITEDEQHYLWVATRQGVCRYDPLLGKFTAIQVKTAKGQEPLAVVARAVQADHHNNIFIGTEGSGLMVCRNAATTAVHISLEKQGTLTNAYGVQVIKKDKDNNIWVLVQNQGLYKLDQQAMVLRPLGNTIVKAISMETDGRHVWLGGMDEVYEYNIAAATLRKLHASADGQLLPGAVTALMIDQDQQLWIGSESGNISIWNFATQHMDHLTAGDTKYSLTGGAVHALYEDPESRKWIGTLRSGINILDPHKNRFQTITREPGNTNTLSGNVIAALYEAADGQLYIGTDGAGLNVWNRERNTFTTFTQRNTPTLSDNFITDIKGDKKGDIWIATFTNGINRYHPTTRQFKKYACINPVTGEENRVVFCLYTDARGDLWAATLRNGGVYGGLYRYNPAADRFDAFDNRLSDLFSLREDSRGVLWGGNLNQLIKIDKAGKAHQYFTIGHLVRTMTEDEQGNFWIGTEGGGLILFDRNQQKIVARYTTNEGLSNDVILSILPDGKGNLWMSTFNGLCKFNTLTRTCKNYYQDDGLQSNQFSYNAGLALHSGDMVFGGIKGLNIFTPATIDTVYTMPGLFFANINVNGRTLAQADKYIRRTSEDQITHIEVPYSEAVFSFNFTALEYSLPRKIRYAYFMEGWDRNWNYTGSLRTASYTHLNEGSYTLRIKNTNAGGTWNTRELILHITVLPPWYRSWWALIGYGLFATTLVYLFFRYKVRQNRLRYDISVARLNAQKEKEVNDKKIAFFTHISHEFRTPLTLIINPVKQLLAGSKDENTEELNVVFRNARRLLSLVDQLLLFRKADSDGDTLKLVQLDFLLLCREVYLCFVQQARLKKIDYRFEVPAVLPELYADREKMEIVLFNLLSNALKFTPAGGSVTFGIRETATTVIVTVADSGYGIPAEVGDQLFSKFYQVPDNNVSTRGGFGIGLYLVKHFAESHHGKIRYESLPGKGTAFELTLLKGQEHFGQQPIYQDIPETSAYLQELAEVNDTPLPEAEKKDLTTLITEKQTILVVDDDQELRKYITRIFEADFTVLESETGEEGLRLATLYLPDIIISDITMKGMTGVALCTKIKENAAIAHIPVVLVTASTASDIKLKGIESGADDYITKPFETELLKARVVGILKKRNVLQQYFYNEITLKKNDLKVSVEYREFLDRCIHIVESHLDSDNFSIKTFASEIGMSQSGLYQKIKSVSGQSTKGFIRFIRLRKAAEIMINTENNITEIAVMVGFNDIKYFREHFVALFGMNPSEYIRKYRKPFHNNLQLNKKIIRE